MYLLVFTTLMIAIIGLYTEVVGLQTARFAAGQSGVGTAMLQWHAAAVSMAVSITKTNTTDYPSTVPSGCSLTETAPVPGMALCPSPRFVASPSQPGCGAGPVCLAVNSPASTGGTITAGGFLNRINYYHPQIPPPPAAPVTAAFYSDDCVHLLSICLVADTLNKGCSAPHDCTTTYKISNYQFYSVLYRDPSTSQDLVVTFQEAPVISATNPAPGNITLASGVGLGLSISDLSQQLGRAGVPTYSYGTFQGFPFSLGHTQIITAGTSYNLPAALSGLCVGSTTCVANGSLGIVSTPNGMNN